MDTLPGDSDPFSLARLFDLGSDDGGWPSAELAEFLSLLLAAPLAEELLKTIPDEAIFARQFADGAIPPISTFSDLLQHANPPIELVEIVQQFAEWQLKKTDSPLPTPVAKALACGTIAVLMVRCDRAAKDLDIQVARQGLEWAAKQTWLPNWLRELLIEAGKIDEGDRPPANSEMPDHSTPVIPGYRIEGQLGQGGMGIVWRAIQKSTRRPVALKLIGPAAFGSERGRLRFEREVELASRLEHPNVARVYHSGNYHGLSFYAMELIEGHHLDDFVSEQKLGSTQILSLVRTVCDAVQYAHQRGVIHRDLKPSNVLVTTDGQPHIVDFGLAKGVEQAEGDLSVTQEGHLAGTLAFMSPEQAAGDSDHIDTRTDVYSLGAMLYLLLVGDTPHDSHGPRYEVIHRIASEKPRDPRALNSDIDAELEALLLKAIAPEPDERYESAEALSHEIGHYLAGEPLTAKVHSTVYLSRKWLARHRGASMLGGVLLLIIAASAFDWVHVHRRNSRARSEPAAPSSPFTARAPSLIEGWGNVFDTSGACTIKGDKDKVTITVPGTLPKLRIKMSVDAPRVMRDVEGDFTASVKVTGEFNPGDKSTRPEGYPFNGAGLLIRSDDENCIRLERNIWWMPDEQKSACYTPLFQYFKAGHEEPDVCPPGTTEAFFKGSSTWFRLERKGDHVTAFYSHDGIEWILVEQIPVGLPKKVKAGVAAINTSNKAFTAEFSEFKIVEGKQ